MQKIVRKRIHYACVMALIVVTCVVQGCEKKVEKKVFSVTADAKISNDEGNKRLQIIVDIDNISDEDIIKLELQTGNPICYELDDTLKPIRHYYLKEV